MQDRSNTIIGWVLFGSIVALGASVVSGNYFHSERPEKMGYPIEGVEEEGGAAAGPPFATLLAAADPVAGEAVFKKCTACHTVNAGGATGIGPNLHGVVGKSKAAGSFAYSGALKEKGGSWDFEALNQWLTSPKKFAPGTTMSFAGLGKAEDRANLVAYLNTQGSNLPLPTAPAPEGEDPTGNEAAPADPTAPAEAGKAAGAQAAGPASGTIVKQAATGNERVNKN